jgi:putative ABC transport system permease protein
MRLSVFQGTILIAENQFVEKFPAEEGYRMFLMSSEFGVQSSGFTRKYERAGLDVIPAVDRLLEFYAVESTYLAMFMVLGALGLAVGSMGMGVVVLRNVQDRRAEMALLRATGYRTAVLWKLLAMEHGLLLAAGLVIGMVASALAMVPALLISTSQVSFGSLLGLLAVVAGCGIICMAIAIHISLRGNALDALRNE